MTRRIWKYAIPYQDAFFIEMPAGAEILAVSTQHNAPRLWALVDPDQGPEIRNFQLVGTGRPGVTDGATYIGTFETNGQTFVGHVFEVVSEANRHRANGVRVRGRR